MRFIMVVESFWLENVGLLICCMMVMMMTGFAVSQKMCSISLNAKFITEKSLV